MYYEAHLSWRTRERQRESEGARALAAAMSVDRSMAGGIMRSDVVIYVDTNISTRFLIPAARSQTIAELREFLKCHHESLYPEMGKVTLQELMVEVNSHRYPIVDRTFVGAIFAGEEGFLKVNMVCQTGGRICLPVECGDAFQSNSQPSPINVVEGATNTRAESAFLTEREELGVDNCRKKCLVVTQKEKLSASFKSKDNLSSQLIELAIAGEASISNALNSLGAANASGKSSSKLLEGESSEGKPAFFDKMLFDADFLTQSSSGNVYDSVGFQLEDTIKSEGKETCLSQETGGNTTIRSLEFSAPEICLNSLINIRMCKESQDGICLASEGTSVLNGKSQRIKADVLGALGESTNIDSRELLLSEQNQAPKVNESSHPLDVYTQDQVNWVKSKEKGSKSSKSRFRRMRHEADCMKVLIDANNMIDRMARYSEEKAFSPGNLGGILLNDPLSKSGAMIAGSEGTKIIGATDLESRKSRLGKAVRVEKSLHPEEISGTVVKSLKAHEIESKSKKPKEVTLLTEITWQQEHGENSSHKNESGLIDKHQLSLNAVDKIPHCDLAGKDSTLNKSTDMEMDNLIASLLSFTDAKPMPSEEEGKISTCSMSTASLKTTNALQHFGSSGSGSSKDVLGFAAVYQNYPTNKSSKYKRKKRKKRKVLVVKTKKQSGSSADDFENACGVSNGEGEKYACNGKGKKYANNGKGEKYANLQEAEDKSTVKKEKLYQCNKLTGGEIEETSSQSEHNSNNEDGSNRLESILPQIAVEIGDIHASKLKKRKNLKAAGRDWKIEAEWMQKLGETIIVNKHACSRLNPKSLHGSESENFNEEKVKFQRDSFSENILHKHEKGKSCYSSPDEFETRSERVYEKAEADGISKDMVSVVLPSSRKNKANKKGKVVHAAKQQEKPNTDGLSETQSKETEVQPVALEFKEIAMDSRHHGNGVAVKKIDGPVTDKIEMKINSPMTRLSKKNYLDKVNEDAVNRAFQEDMCFTEDMTFPTKCTSLAVRCTEHNDRSSKSSEYTDELPTTSKSTNVRPKTESLCPAGCGRVFRGKTSAWYLHRKTCKGF